MQQLGNKQYQPKRLEYWLGGEGGGGDSEGKGDVVNQLSYNEQQWLLRPLLTSTTKTHQCWRVTMHFQDAKFFSNDISG